MEDSRYKSICSIITYSWFEMDPLFFFFFERKMDPFFTVNSTHQTQGTKRIQHCYTKQANTSKFPETKHMEAEILSTISLNWILS